MDPPEVQKAPIQERLQNFANPPVPHPVVDPLIANFIANFASWDKRTRIASLAEATGLGRRDSRHLIQQIPDGTSPREVLRLAQDLLSSARPFEEEDALSAAFASLGIGPSAEAPTRSTTPQQPPIRPLLADPPAAAKNGHVAVPPKSSSSSSSSLPPVPPLLTPPVSSNQRPQPILRPASIGTTLEPTRDRDPSPGAAQAPLQTPSAPLSATVDPSSSSLYSTPRTILHPEDSLRDLDDSPVRQDHPSSSMFLAAQGGVRPRVRFDPATYDTTAYRASDSDARSFHPPPDYDAALGYPRFQPTLDAAYRLSPTPSSWDHPSRHLCKDCQNKILKYD